MNLQYILTEFQNKIALQSSPKLDIELRKNTEKIKILYHASFISNKNNEIFIWLAEPTDLNGQKVQNFSVNLKSNSKYLDKGNIIHYFKSFGQNIELNVDIETILSQQCISDGIFIFSKLPKKISNYYLRSEKYLEQTQEVIELTKKITDGIETSEKKVEVIFKYVVESFKYRYPVKKRGVLNLNFNNLTGDCAEYSSLFVTMCRISGIAARNVTGFVIFEDKKHISEHGWAQVYVNDEWLDADTQYASLENNIGIGMKKYLYNRSDYRIIFTIGFDIELKPHIPNHFNISTIRDLAIIVDSNKAQVLQPLVFASKNKINYKDNIVLR